MLFRLVGITEKDTVPAKRGAVDLRLSSNGATECLIQEFAAGVALLSDIEALRADTSEFGGGELHASPPSRCSSLLG
jgi:hypothetical protein